MEIATPDRIRAWLWAGRLVMVLFLSAIAIGTLTSQFWILIPAVILATASGLVLDPKRVFWGPGPMRVMSDPDERRNYRRQEIRFLILAFVGMTVLVMLVIAATTVSE